MRFALFLTALALLAAHIGPAEAATCRNTGSFEKWLADFKKEALAQGISSSVLAAASPYLQFEQRIVNRDRAQGVFNQSFLKFSDRMIAGYRMQNGQQQMKSHADLFSRVEKEFGVPAPILTAFWGLESDFGKNTGKSNVFVAITTLAYDCRRPDYFRPQLFDALRIVQRGDLTIDEMQGGDWAGELGAMQFTASDYYKYAVDYDGDGRRNLVKSTPDTIASAANFLKNLGWKRGEPWLEEVRLTRDLPWDQADLGWKRGEPWLEEVRLTRDLPWDQADLAIQHPRSQWTAWGVRSAHGTLPADGMKASLLLPMGRSGPAFLAYDNFQVLLGWNSSMVYVTTVAYFATRLAGAPPVNRGDPDIEVLQPEQVMELQRLLTQQGDDIGDIDGKVGSKTRVAVKKAQLKVGLPADSYPSTELIERLRARGSRR